MRMKTPPAGPPDTTPNGPNQLSDNIIRRIRGALRIITKPAHLKQLYEKSRTLYPNVVVRDRGTLYL